MEFEVLAEGLLFPEGPIALPDGSVVLVEILRGTLTRVWPGGRAEVIADLGGGPNGAALGPDGAVYVCNNGGLDWSRDANGALVLRGTMTADYDGGRIERVDLATGRFERLYTHWGEDDLRGPNDLVFDAAGGFWFTDNGKLTARQRDVCAVYYALPDGSRIERGVSGGLSFNGVGLSPDQSTLYVADTLSARLWAHELEAPGQMRRDETGRRQRRRLVGGAPGDTMLDSLAVTEAGKVCVGALLDGGIAEFDPVSGFSRLHAFPDTHVTNICFGGPDRRWAYITLSHTGVLVRARWPEPGLALNFHPY